MAKLDSSTVYGDLNVNSVLNTTGTISIVSDSNNLLKLIDPDTSVTSAAPYMSWYAGAANRMGYFGFSSSSSANIALANEETGDILLIPNNGSSKLYDSSNITLETTSTGVAVTGTICTITGGVGVCDTSGYLCLAGASGVQLWSGNVRNLYTSATSAYLAYNQDIKLCTLTSGVCVIGTLTSTTPATACNDTTVATTAFVKAQGYGTGTSNLVLGTTNVTAACGSHTHSIYLLNNNSDTTSGTITAAGFSGPLTGNASTATKLNTINTTFTGNYPIAFNVNGTIYSNSSINFCGNTNTLQTTTYCATTAYRSSGAGYGYCAGTGCGTAVDWVATSDCRIKKNIEPITSALSKVNALCGVCYEFCEDGTLDMGLIAQAVEIVEPRLVSHNEEIPEEYKKYGVDDDLLSLKYDKFAGLLVEAIKELKQQNECLQIQINELRKIK